MALPRDLEESLFSEIEEEEEEQQQEQQEQQQESVDDDVEIPVGGDGGLAEFMESDENDEVEAVETVVVDTTTAVVEEAVVEQQEEVGWSADPNNPMYISLYGHPWTYEERAAYGNQQYLEVKERAECEYVKVLHPAPTHYAKMGKTVTINTKSVTNTKTTTVVTTMTSSNDAEEEGTTTTRTTTETTIETTIEEQEQRRTKSHVIVLRPNDLIQQLSSTNYFARPKPNEPLRMVSFAKAWMRDPDARCIERIDFDPRRPSGIYLLADDNEAATGSKKKQRWAWNNWPGILAASLPAVPVRDAVVSKITNDDSLVKEVMEEDTTVAFGLSLIRQHMMEVLFAEDPETSEAHCEWFLDYLATIVQRPWAKTGVAVFFTGVQGAGKNTLLDWFRLRIVGADITIQLTDPKQGLFDNFGTAHDKRVLVQLDEVQAKKMQQCESGMKNLDTADSLHVQKKYKNRIESPNFVNVVGTTNSKYAFHVSKKERRKVLFNVSPNKAGNHKYFEELHKHALENDVVNRAFYDMLMARDISRYGEQLNLQKGRPITKYFRLCQSNSLDTFVRFMSAIVNQRLFLGGDDHDDDSGDAPPRRLVQVRDHHHDVASPSTPTTPKTPSGDYDEEDEMMMEASSEVTNGVLGGRTTSDAVPFPILYSHYVAFVNRNREPSKASAVMSNVHFGARLQDMIGARLQDMTSSAIVMKRTNAFKKFEFNYDALQVLLIQTESYDPNAMTLEPASQFRSEMECANLPPNVSVRAEKELLLFQEREQQKKRRQEEEATEPKRKHRRISEAPLAQPQPQPQPGMMMMPQQMMMMRPPQPMMMRPQPMMVMTPQGPMMMMTPPQSPAPFMFPPFSPSTFWNP